MINYFVAQKCGSIASSLLSALASGYEQEKRLFTLSASHQQHGVGFGLRCGMLCLYLLALDFAMVKLILINLPKVGGPEVENNANSVPDVLA